ncbi:MAG: CsbD family protein [Alphaproteobacteria bacterium]|nr:CsbD family protein [Alphaproteobacteria bacterium]
MNTDELKGRWHQVKGTIKQQWGRLTDDEIDEIDGNYEKMVGLIQEKYGKAREEAERELDAVLKH